ncbi:GT-D fold domain-containing glycosyltransferase [Streptococcus iniae]|uniref:GT-D fold domain-containing glycosyltransferase n=1 Tax=Streptococcus iniae TaxID=1346 RepID=UPI0020C111B7|nr:GT-D fold domain-containing glycosyltransferase [Streptococcus iniae]
MDSLDKIKVYPILESLDFIIDNNASVARFGDGEIDIMSGHSIPYQTYDEALAGQLRDILRSPSNETFLVCLPDVFNHLERYNSNARVFWEKHFERYAPFYLEKKVLK